MILTCELCQSQFLTESDPHVIIPGPETKIYCYCQVKSDDDQKWIDQLRHEHKLYQKHLSALKAENERLESENANLKEQDQIISQEIKTYILIADKLQAENTELKQKLSSVWKEAERFYLED